MATQTEIVNRALRKLGANKLLTDIDNVNDKNAIIMKDLYSESLEILLAQAFWMFAIKRADLVVSSETNEWTKYDLDNIYDVPTDMVRIMGWSSEYAIVRQEGDLFLTDSADLGILYVWSITDTTAFPSHFTEAFVDRLALDASYVIVQKGAITELLEVRYKDSLRQAKAIDAQGETAQSPKADAWINAKYAGVHNYRTHKIYYRS